ncbi:hypothetical protein [Ancylobacter vacuolatus]|uniref:Uncharacterized protein n=1 Tax=Ancylobacter vacuolatus TaxID=223389 RepID=A0ABU0DNN2_9HYPH|nr:hypothetical protein [Ancylobacter vacuolatus]
MGTIDQQGDGYKCHAAGAPDGSFVIRLQQQGAAEAEAGIIVGKAPPRPTKKPPFPGGFSSLAIR